MQDIHAAGSWLPATYGNSVLSLDISCQSKNQSKLKNLFKTKLKKKKKRSAWIHRNLKTCFPICQPLSMLLNQIPASSLRLLDANASGSAPIRAVQRNQQEQRGSSSSPQMHALPHQENLPGTKLASCPVQSTLIVLVRASASWR